MVATFLDTMRRALTTGEAAELPNSGGLSDLDALEKRSRRRQRTRLRTGKVLDFHNNFIVECIVHDRSVSGARIRLLKAANIPGILRVYDDERQTLTTATVVWHRDFELGLRYLRENDESRIKTKDLEALARRYYAI
ncbi:MAG TPA: PilZ domain-containing protein [Beijerinckiaceae bacterium]|jgi:hypothetical protein|nr:PilZ domain-containing protein [Beijerinckiaceae bacterium]